MITLGDYQAVAKMVDDGKTEQAHSIACEMFREAPESPHLANIMAHCHLKAGRHETAYYLYRYVQKFKDYDGPQIWSNIGHCLAESGRLDESERWYLKAVAKQPDQINLASLASIYAKKGDPKRAVECAERALRSDPECKTAKWNGALAKLKLRQWKDGWDWYDALLGTKQRPHPPTIDGSLLPVWDGKGGTVLIHGEQGLGDEIMFSSMIEETLQNADDVVLAVDPRLIGLLQRSFPKAIVVSRYGKELVVPKRIDITHRFALGSLGRFYRQTDESFPGTPWLTPDPLRVRMYKALVESLGPGKKIGLLWKSGIGGLDEHERAIQLLEMEPLLSADCQWVSLSHLPNAEAECARFYDVTGIKIHHFPFVHSKDYDDTAALVKSLDAVVAITGSVAHCAAALGVDTHVLVPRMPQWRYGHEGSSIPWYKSMTLYRQDKAWPFEDVRAALGLR